MPHTFISCCGAAVVMAVDVVVLVLAVVTAEPATDNESAGVTDAWVVTVEWGTALVGREGGCARLVIPRPFLPFTLGSTTTSYTTTKSEHAHARCIYLLRASYYLVGHGQDLLLKKPLQCLAHECDILGK